MKTIDQGYFDDATNSRSIKTAGNLDLLGIAIEAGISDRTYQHYDNAVWGDIYQPYHNNGHAIIAHIQDS